MSTGPTFPKRQSIREAVQDMGAPLFVPGGQLVDWQFSGYGRDKRGVHEVLVLAPVKVSDDRHEFLQIETNSHDQDWSSMLVSRTLDRSLPHDISFPYTVTVDQQDVVLTIDGDAVRFTLIVTAAAWAAFAAVGNRWVVIEACETAIEDVELHRVDDVENLPDERFDHT